MAETVQLTAAHWVYAAFVILIFVPLPCGETLPSSA